MELKLLEQIRKAGVLDEHQLAKNLDLKLEELHKLLQPLINAGYLTRITKHGRDCLQCSSRFACPSSRIHLMGPDTTFFAYRLTSEGMRYRRQLLSEKDQ